MKKSNLYLRQILIDLVDQRISLTSLLPELSELILADKWRSQAFGITPANVNKVIEQRSHLFKDILIQLQTQIETHTFFSNLDFSYFLLQLWNLWLPLALQIVDRRKSLQRPFIQGILGGQGTGKTTLTKILTLIFDYLGYSSVSISLDDIYKTYLERCRLKEIEPRLIWRGPPGTHDIALGLTVLEQLQQPNQPYPIFIPRFDKSDWGGVGDRSEPEIIMGADIVLFEGWFVGVRPIEPVAFDNPPQPIVSEADKAFARDMNTNLQDYLALWEYLDSLMVLYPVDYRLSLQWRQQAEREMIANGKTGMSDAEIEEFVKYFWKSLHPELFIKPLISNAELVDLVVEINADHSAGMVYTPRDK